MKSSKEINPRDGHTESPWQSVVSSVSDQRMRQPVWAYLT